MTNLVIFLLGLALGLALIINWCSYPPSSRTPAGRAERMRMFSEQLQPTRSSLLMLSECSLR